jgi:hypothetical protein
VSLLLRIALIREDIGCIGLKLFSPAVQQRAGDPKGLTHFFLRGVTLHAFQYHFEFELWCLTLPFDVHVIPYLSLLLCLLYQVLDISLTEVISRPSGKGNKGDADINLLEKRFLCWIEQIFEDIP